MGLCSCLASCLAWGVQHCSLLVVEWSWVLVLRQRSLGELSPIDITGARRSLVDQCPELGSPTSEAQVWHLARAQRPFQPHGRSPRCCPFGLHEGYRFAAANAQFTPQLWFEESLKAFGPEPVPTLGRTPEARGLGGARCWGLLDRWQSQTLYGQAWKVGSLSPSACRCFSSQDSAATLWNTQDVLFIFYIHSFVLFFRSHI